jgi:TATA-box binding protein (TBP) (component of TFIID and TFIIIB)
MFTTPSAVPTATAVVRPSFQIISTTSSSSTNPSWRSTTPAVVSILNGNSPTLYIATQPPTTTGNLLRQSSQTVRLVSPSFTLINNSNTILTGQVPILSTLNNNNSQSGIAIDTSVLGRLTTPTNPREEQNGSLDTDIDLDNNPQDPEIELFVNNVVCSFALGCKLNLRKIAMEGANVIYKRAHAMVLMKIRNPYCSANIWSSGKVTVTGATSEDDAKRGARRIARCIQRLGFKAKFRNFRVVNCLATCSMPWPIDIEKLRDLYPTYVSYEPEIHPGATVRLNNKAVLKVFTTGSITLTAPSVDVINTAVNEFYPQLFECRKMSRAAEQRQ